MRLPALSVMKRGVVFEKNSYNPDLALISMFWVAYKFLLHLEDTPTN